MLVECAETAACVSIRAFEPRARRVCGKPALAYPTARRTSEPCQGEAKPVDGESWPSGQSARQTLATATSRLGLIRMTTRASTARAALRDAPGPCTYFSVIRRVQVPSASGNSSASHGAHLTVGPLAVLALALLDVDAEPGSWIALQTPKVGTVGQACQVKGTVLPHKPQRCDVRKAAFVDAGEASGNVEREQRRDLTGAQRSGRSDHGRDEGLRRSGPGRARRNRRLRSESVTRTRPSRAEPAHGGCEPRVRVRAGTLEPREHARPLVGGLVLRELGLGVPRLGV